MIIHFTEEISHLAKYLIVFYMDIYYGFKMDGISPVRLAQTIHVPVLIIHGEKDQSFPLYHAWRLRDSFPGGGAELFVATGSDHSNSSLDPRYPDAIKSFVSRHLKVVDVPITGSN